MPVGLVREAIFCKVESGAVRVLIRIEENVRSIVFIITIESGDQDWKNSIGVVPTLERNDRVADIICLVSRMFRDQKRNVLMPLRLVLAI